MEACVSLADGYIPHPPQPGPKKGGWLVRLILNIAGAIKPKGKR